METTSHKPALSAGAFAPSSSSSSPAGLTSTPRHTDGSVHSEPSLATSPQGADGSGGLPGSGAPGQVDDAKRPRACEACRGLKVKCEMAEEGPCRRCRKSGRRCIVTVRTRNGERQRKTDTRVAELEKKIDALTASLQARGGSGSEGIPAGVPASASPAGAPPRSSGAAQSAGSGAEISKPQDLFKSLLKDWGVSCPAAEKGSTTPGGQVGDTPGRKRKASGSVDEWGPSHSPRQAPKAPVQRHSILGADYVDIIDRGLITTARAVELLKRYNVDMVPHLPGVVFPPSLTAAELRSQKPLLFLAVMTVASLDDLALQRTLFKELLHTLAEKAVFFGEKSLETVQTLLLSVTWYWPPDTFEELKFYQLVHTAVIMAIDLGLGRFSSSRKKPVGLGWNLHATRANKDDPESLESRRTWLTCYYLSSNTAMGLRRPYLIRWSRFMEDSIEVLEASPEAAPTDKYLCFLLRTNRLAEQVATQFSLDDPIMPVNLADLRTCLTLKTFERELENLRREAPKVSSSPTLAFGLDSLDILMHELSLHAEPPDSLKSCFPTSKLEEGLLNVRSLTAAHIDAMVACYSAVVNIFESFLALEIDSVRCIPVFNFVRVAYGVVVLIKVYFSAAAADSELGKVLPKEQIKADYYLDSLLARFVAAAADDHCRPASKFLVVLAMLRGWFNSKFQNGNANKGEGADNTAVPGQAQLSGPQVNSLESQNNSVSTPIPAPARSGSGSESAPPRSALMRPPMHPDQARNGLYQPQGSLPPSYPTGPAANTPLQLLSEVATGDSNVGARSSHHNWISRPSPAAASGGHPPPQFMYDDGRVSGVPVMDGTAPAPGPVSWPYTPSPMGVGFDMLADQMDWEGLAMNLGMGIFGENEPVLASMMNDPNKSSWMGESMMEGIPATMYQQ